MCSIFLNVGQKCTMYQTQASRHGSSNTTSERCRSGNNAMLADEILGEYGDVSNLNIDFLIEGDSDGDNVELIRPSLYYEMTSLPRDLGQNLHRFNILSLNAQSLRAKYDELTIFIELARQQNILFHAICIQETWMDSNADFSQINIEGYNVFAETKRSECSEHGGLIVRRAGLL